jgi:4-hydroxy-tetrahydrodipicolinate reductase
MPIRILVNGAQGRMGQVTAKTLEAEPGFTLVGQTGREDELALVIKETKAQVVVDFTQPAAVYENTQTIIKAGARPVIGTTGLSSQQIKKLQERCKKLKRGGIIAPNFSIGMVLMMKYAQEFVKYFPEVEIIEMHHDRKRDCPSGTALYTAESLAAARTKRPKTPLEPHESIPGSRGATYLDIPIHAIRLPGLVAHEQIIFGDLGETLTLRHDTVDRQCFMRGVVLACHKVMKLNRLVYGLDQIL